MSLLMSTRGSVLDQYRCSDIYNALDTGNYPLALTKADQVLRKGWLPLAGALRSIALLQLGQEDEAKDQVEQLLRGNVSTSVLPPLSLVMPRLGMGQKLAELYVLASEANPKDKDMAEDALTALLKARMYQRAQQVVLKQFKAKKDKQSYWRYIQLAVLHVRRATLTQSQSLKPPGSVLALQVANRLIQDHPVDVSQLTEETLFLYLRFYMLLGKEQFQSALALLQEPGPKRLVENSLSIQFLLREAWEANGDFGRILDDCRSRIENGDRNWAVISLFTQTLVRESLKAESPALPDHDVRVLISACEKDKWADRGSYLGILEAFRLSRDAKLPVQALTKHGLDYVPLMTKFFSRFSSRASCFDDLRPYLVNLTEPESKAFVEKVKGTQYNLASENGIRTCVNARKIYYLLGDSKETTTQPTSLLREYAQSLDQARLPNTEMQMGDDLVVLAAFETLASSTTECIPSATGLALYGVSESGKAYHLRLLLIRLLLQLGALDLAADHFEALGLKAVQWDTASHYGLDRNTAFGGTLHKVYAKQYTDHLKKFYAQSQFEVPDAIGQAFSNNKFSQIAHLSEFKKRVDTSCTRALVELDLIRARLIQGDLDGHEKKQAIKTVQRLVAIAAKGGFSDQRDDTLIPCYDESKWDTIQRATSCGPKRATSWISTFLEVVASVLDVEGPAPQELGDELTDAETALVSFVRSLHGMDTPVNSAALFFQRKWCSLTAGIASLVEKAANCFEALHAAWIGIEVRAVSNNTGVAYR